MRKFTHINEAFKCESCNKNVPPSSKSCRNHCPFCLCSKHVDHFPGDRANPCKGIMQAIGYKIDSNKGLSIVFKCLKCQKITINIAVTSDKIAPDNYELILSLGPHKID